MTKYTEFDFLAISDTHFDIDLAGYSREHELFEVWNAILDYAEKEKIKDIVVAGDLFHRNKPNPRTVALFVESVIERKKLTFHCIGGNHDAHLRLKSSVLAPLEAFRSTKINIYTRPTLGTIGTGDRPNIPCFYLPYPVDDNYDDQVKDHLGRGPGTIPPFFGIGHFNIPNAEVGEGLHLSDPGGHVFPDYLLGDGGVFINGHYHLGQRINRTGTTILIPGSMIRLNFGDQSDKEMLRVKAKLKTSGSQFTLKGFEWDWIETPKVKKMVVLKIDLRKGKKVRLPGEKAFKNAVVKMDCVMDMASDVTEFYTIQDKVRKWADMLIPQTPKLIAARVKDDDETIDADIKPEKALEEFVAKSPLNKVLKKSVVKVGTDILRRVAE